MDHFTQDHRAIVRCIVWIVAGIMAMWRKKSGSMMIGSSWEGYLDTLTGEKDVSHAKKDQAMILVARRREKRSSFLG